jgi:predicted porin
MILRSAMILSLSVMSSVAMADALDINLNDKAAQVTFSKAAGGNFQGDAAWHVGALYNNDKSNFFDAGLLVKGEEGSIPGLTLGLGAKALLATINSPAANTKNVASALAIGLEVGYVLPTAKKISVVADVYGSLKIVTFNDADRVLQSSVRAEYEVVPQTFAYIGYRYLHATLTADGTDKAIDDGAVFGIKMGF